MMTHDDIAALRLANQGLTGRRFDRPADVVAWLGAVQCQEAAVARWSLGARCEAVTDDQVLQALADGDIVRTHLLRPTWHFVARDDLRWLAELTRPKVLALSAYQDRKLGIDEAQFAHSQRVMVRALRDHRHLTRDQLSQRLQADGLSATGPRLSHFLMRAELSLLVCSGSPVAGAHTYALVDERVPASAPLPRDEALARLATRYFTSHGPATLKDFMTWASLGARDAQRAVDAAGSALSTFKAAGSDWVTGTTPRVPLPPRPERSAHWLQGYDEYLVAHSDSRQVAAGPVTRPRAARPGQFIHVLVVDGRIAGHWRRDGADRLCLDLARPLQPAEQHVLWCETQRLAAFLGRPVAVVLQSAADGRGGADNRPA